MARQFAFLRLAAPACLALAAGLAAASPAAAQFLGPWGGGWGGPFGRPPVRYFGPPPDMVDDARIPPRVVAGILRAQGYRLVSAPRLSGENLIAFGENADGQRARFLIDAYEGELLQMRPAGGGIAIGRNVPPANLALGGPGEIDGGRMGGGQTGGGLAEPMIDRVPNAEKPQRAAPKARTASHAPVERRQAEPRRAPPSQATRIPKSPVQQAAPVPANAAPVPAHAAVAPAPVETPLAPDAKPQAKPADIGPRVQPVEARAPAAPASPPAVAAPQPDLTP